MTRGKLWPNKSYPGIRLITLRQSWTTLGCRTQLESGAPNHQTPGEWTGSITLSLENVGLCVTVSEIKWNKSKEIIGNLLAKFNHVNHFPDMNLKDTEQKTGFLVNLAMTYPLIMTVLRGIYLTMNS